MRKKRQLDPPGYFCIIVRSGFAYVPTTEIPAYGVMELGRWSLETS